MHSSLFTSTILGVQLTTTTFPPLENLRQRMKFSHKCTVNNLINDFKSLKVFCPWTWSGLLVENIGLLNLLLSDGDGVIPDDDGISPGEIGLVCSFSSSNFSMFLTECFSGLPKNCVCRLLLLDELELLETCESLSPSPLFFSFIFYGLVLSAVLISSDLFSATLEVVPIFAFVFPSLLCEVIFFFASVTVNCWPSSESLCVLFFSVIGTKDIGQSILSYTWLVHCTSFVEIGIAEIGLSPVVCASGLFATGGNTCTSCSGNYSRT